MSEINVRINCGNSMGTNSCGNSMWEFNVGIQWGPIHIGNQCGNSMWEVNGYPFIVNRAQSLDIANKAASHHF